MLEQTPNKYWCQNCHKDSVSFFCSSTKRLKTIIFSLFMKQFLHNRNQEQSQLQGLKKCDFKLVFSLRIIMSITFYNCMTNEVCIHIHRCPLTQVWLPVYIKPIMDSNSKAIINLPTFKFKILTKHFAWIFKHKENSIKQC